jgi:tetratricopeptide (TPR) repeat protein
MDRLGQFLLGLAILVVGALLSVWFVWRTLKKSEDPGRIAYKWVITGVVFCFLMVIGAQASKASYGSAFVIAGAAAGCGVLLGILWAPHLGAVLASMFTSLYDGGDTAPEVRPFYSIARAKQKRGHYQEAIAEVHKQLQRFPEDYEGWMLLAEIYASDLKDNLSAQDCLKEILRHDGHAPRNIVYTLNRSADWHLEHAADREAARAALDEIIQRFPGSEFAHTAAQRIAHLTSSQMLSDQRQRPTIRLAHHDAKIGLEGKVADPRPISEEPTESAARLVEHLQSFPDDAEAREQLATLYADHFQRMDLAADQVEQLIGTPGATQKEIAHWLNLLADFHLRVDQDRSATEAALKRIIDLFPGSAVAGLAESRLAYLEGEFRRNSKSQVLRLGSYEERLGLKGQVPKKPV